MSKKSKNAAKALKRNRPKKKCCESRPRCQRCPLRMLAEGTLPAGYGVKHRKLVVIERDVVEAGLTTKPKKTKLPKKSKRKKQRPAPEQMHARRAA